MKYILLLVLLAAGTGQDHPALTITHLTGDCYIYTTYGLAGGQPYPANSF